MWIIAEIGINHGGDEARCAKLIDAAADSGADAVKLQTVTPEESYHPDTESYGLFLDADLSVEALRRLSGQAADRGMVLFSTPGDITALRKLLSVNVPVIKISSGLLTNLPLIAAASKSGLPLILSTGMAHLKEVETAVSVARTNGATDIAVLQCTSLYPAPTNTLNLRAMETLRSVLETPVGYSDHHVGTLACVAAVAAGASVIEKHFSLNRSEMGADHAISSEPAEFREMVDLVREVEEMRGSPVKEPTSEEARFRDGRHRLLVASRDIAAGERIDAADIYLMRMPHGTSALPAGELPNIVGMRAIAAIPRLTGLTRKMLDHNDT